MLRRNEHSAVYTTIPPLLSKDGFRRCLYCGEPANTREHYPPVSRVADYMALGHDFYVIFGACSDCNSIAAADLDETIFDRIERVKDKIAARGRKYTKIPDWDQSELDELSDFLREDVEKSLRLKESVLCRVNYYEGLEHMQDCCNLR
jgi:hypothetical protein